MPIPSELTEPAAAIASRLVERSETVAVAESSSGGLISAALLSVPGASAYYLGGVVIYTVAARRALLAGLDVPKGMRGATEDFARFLSDAAITKLGTTWGVSETGAAGPAGNPYGDPAGHSWVAVSGPRAQTANVRTGSADREANMIAFAAAALGLLRQQLAESGP